jgi:hypothetical protein
VNLEKEKAGLGWAFLVEMPFGIRLDGDGYLLNPPEFF